MGAQVIKIRTPGIGDSSRQYGSFLNDEPHRERSGLYLYLNSNKKGITLNLETPTGRSILRHLVSQADALVHNLPVAAMEQLGVEYSQLSQTNPSLIVATINFLVWTGLTATTKPTTSTWQRGEESARAWARKEESL